jgi:lipopolysaccharide biosynthesis glycosyltransferase
MNSIKTAVITINIGTAMQRMADMTIPTMRAYAQRIGADFIVIDKIPASYQFQDYSAYWAKFILRDYLESYDRLMYVDLDTIVHNNCPNMFELVPEDRFAALIEDDYGVDQTEEIAAIQAKFGDIGWRKGYFNVGVMVASKAHKAVFELRQEMLGGTRYPEQTAMNYNLQKAGIPVYKLNHKFNHMYFLNIEHNDRHLSYISHYAGFSQQLREAVIAEDKRRLAAGELLINDNNINEFILTQFTPAQIESMTQHSLLKDAEVFKAQAEPA